MELKKQFQEIAERIGKNETGELKVCIEGVEYTRLFRPQERLILLGAGHIAQPVCTIGAMLGFAVTVVDDRASFANRTRFAEAKQILCEDFAPAVQQLNINSGDYVAVITRGHRFDAECLRALLKGTMPRYLGLLGSKRRTRGLLNLLEQEGFERAKLNSICTPIGLDLGALSVQEIAVSICAELVKHRRMGFDRHSKAHILTEESCQSAVLEEIISSHFAKVLLLVYETSGSTPVKAGACMTVNEFYQTCGSIGGGCAEGAALREAVRLLGTGQSRCIVAALNDEIAAEDGMVCGGEMKIFMADLTQVAKEI